MVSALPPRSDAHADHVALRRTRVHMRLEWGAVSVTRPLGGGTCSQQQALGKWLRMWVTMQEGSSRHAAFHIQFLRDFRLKSDT